MHQEQWQLLNKYSIFHFILTFNTRLRALFTTCYTNTAPRDSIYYFLVSFSIVLVTIISGYAANIKLHSPSKATPQYMWLFHYFYLLWEVPILQIFFFKTCDLYAIKCHTSSATLDFNNTRTLQCDCLPFPSISHHFISLSWNRDLNEDTLWTKHYPNHHFARYFAASLTHSLPLRLFYFKYLKLKDWLYSPALKRVFP